MTEYIRGTKAGVISGLLWGGLVAAAFALNVEIFYSQLANSLNQALLTDPNATNGLPVSIFINNNVELAVGEDIVLGAVFGMAIGILFSTISYRFLLNRKTHIKAMIVSLFFYVTYQIAIGPLDVIDIVGSLLATLLAGYLMGVLYDRFGPIGELPGYGTPETPSTQDSSTNQP